MPNEIASRQADEMQNRTLKNQTLAKHQSEMRDLHKTNEDEVQKIILSSQEKVVNLKGAYDVMISKEAESLEERLANVREANDERVNKEKLQGEEEATKTRAMYQDRVKEYKKQGEAKVDAVRKEAQAQMDSIHDRAIKSERAEKFAPKQSSKGGTVK